MSKSKKTNPRRVPVSKADLARAKQDARDLAVDTAIALFLTVLRDKEGYGPKRIRRVWDEVQELSDSIVRGYVSIDDLKSALRDEAGINIR